MEITSFQECLKCSKHPNQNIIFIQVNQLQGNKNIFYCAHCILYEDEFKTSNYISFQQVLESSNGFNIANWPPFEDNSLRTQVSSMLSQDQNKHDLISSINHFYDAMKTEIIKKIDDSQKKMIKKIFEFDQYEDQIKEKLQEINLVDSFKNILLNDNSKMSVKDRQWREFINQVNKEKQNYTKEIKQMFDLLYQNKKLIDFEVPNIQKASIIQIIEDINFFKKDKQQNEQLNNKDLLPNLLINSSLFNQKSFEQKMQKLENNSLEITSQIKSFGSYYSNLVLDRNKKYMFRFQFQRINQQIGGFAIGLGIDKTKDKQHFVQDYLAFSISYTDLIQGHYSQYGIDKCVKGNLKETKNINCLELRVCIKDKLLEVVDYPNYNHRYVIADQYKNNLQTYQNFRLGIFLGNSITVTLIYAHICDEFEY